MIQLMFVVPLSAIFDHVEHMKITVHLTSAAPGGPINPPKDTTGCEIKVK